MSGPNFKNKSGQKKGVFPNASTMLPALGLKIHLNICNQFFESIIFNRLENYTE